MVYNVFGAEDVLGVGEGLHRVVKPLIHPSYVPDVDNDVVELPMS